MWNLTPPPGFQGLDPHRPLTVYYRFLLHWRQDGATYFVTFRQQDSLPRVKLDSQFPRRMGTMGADHEERIGKSVLWNQRSDKLAACGYGAGGSRTRSGSFFQP